MSDLLRLLPQTSPPQLPTHVHPVFCLRTVPQIHATAPHMMASQRGGGDSSGRRYSKKRKDSRKEAHRTSLDIPERFKDGDDADEDVTAPKGNNTMSMNQSIFSMIARAGQQSQTDLGTMQEVDSGDSDDDRKRATPHHQLDGANDFPALLDDHDPEREKTGKSKQKQSLSETKLLRSLPKLKTSSRKAEISEAQSTDQMSSSQFLPPQPSPAESPTHSVKEHLSDSKIKLTPGEHAYIEKGKSAGSKSRHGSSAGLVKGKTTMPLAKRLQQIFELDAVEEVISEYPCWLLQSILLQGYMYITQKHICFYAYIPKKHVSYV